MSFHVSSVELNRTFRRGFTLTFTADLLTKLLSALTVVVLIRGLPVSAYAYTTLFLTLAQFAGAAAGGGVRTRYLREEAESLSRGHPGERGGLFAMSLLKGILLVLAVGLCVLPIAGPLHLGAKFGAGPGLILYATAFAAGFGATELAIAHHQARRQFGRAGVLSVTRAAVLLAAAVMIILTHQGVTLLSLCFVAAMVLVGVGTALPIVRGSLDLRILRLRVLRFDREEVWLSLYYLASAGFAYVDLLVASALLDQQQVATLGTAVRYLAIVLAATPSLAAILRVRTAQTDLIESRDAQRLMILRWMRSGSTVIVLTLALTALLAPWGIPLLSGGRYPGSVTVFQIFLVTAMSAYLSAPAVSVLMAQRRYPALAWIFIVGLAANLVGDILVARTWGVIGIAVVSTSVYVVLDLVMTVEALRHAAGLGWPRPRFPLQRIGELAIAIVIALGLAATVAGLSH
jgi:O-antigen/teichoic acid export membrane protein